MQAKLTNQTIRALRPTEKPYEVVDADIKGFLLRVQPSGVMTYYFSYRNEQGKRARYRIGKHGSVSPARARDEAQSLSARVIAGDDVQALKKQERVTAEAARSQTLSGFLEHRYGPWVLTQRKTGDATLKRIESTFAHLLQRSLIEINAWVIEKWRSEALKAGKAKTTTNRDLAALKACLAKALEWDLLSIHPLAKVKPIRTDKLARIRYLTEAEEKRLRAALIDREAEFREKRSSANAWRRARHKELLPDLSPKGYVDHLQPMVLLAINTGLRRGELFQLQWTDIDRDGKTLTVRGGTAKSGQTRHIPLNEEARRTIERWRYIRNQADRVFPGKDGEPLTTIHTSWRGILRAANIEDFRWHDLRHHFASRLVMAGVDLNTIRELLGHSDLEMTLRYAHLSPDHKAEAVGRLDETTQAIST
jgi:integrase